MEAGRFERYRGWKVLDTPLSSGSGTLEVAALRPGECPPGVTKAGGRRGAYLRQHVRYRRIRAAGSPLPCHLSPLEFFSFGNLCKADGLQASDTLPSNPPVGIHEP
jgi:hypothetical protein